MDPLKTHGKDLLTPQGNNKLVVTYRKAVENKPVLDALLLKVGRQTGARPISNLKNPTTTLSKTAEKRAEDPKRGYKIDDVNDVARGRLVYGSIDALSKGIDLFKKDIKQSGLKIAKTEDFFKKPQDGYKGYHVDVEFPNGQKSEVQFHTVQSYTAALATHASHAQFNDAKPEDVAVRDKKINETIDKMEPQQAAQVASQVEAQNAPLAQASQIDALHTAQGAQGRMQQTLTSQVQGSN